MSICFLPLVRKQYFRATMVLWGLLVSLFNQRERINLPRAFVLVNEPRYLNLLTSGWIDVNHQGLVQT